MNAGEGRALVLSLLDAAAGPVLVAGRDAGTWEAALRAAGRTVSGAAEAPAAALVSFTGEGGDAGARRLQLGAVHTRLAPGAPLLLIDHNRPRQWWRRPLAAILLAARGLPPSRARYPAARELDAAGFRVERLRLAAGERLQLVLARREA